MCVVLNTPGSKLGMNTDSPTENAFISTSYFGFCSHRLVTCTGRRHCDAGLTLGVTTLGDKKLIPLSDRVTAIKKLQSGGSLDQHKQYTYTKADDVLLLWISGQLGMHKGGRLVPAP